MILSFFDKKYNYTNVVHFVKTGVIQVVIQIISFCCGILITRQLSTTEYSYFTITNTIIGAIIFLSDSGLSIGVLSIASGYWSDKGKLGSILNTALVLRTKISLIVFSILIVVLIYSLRVNQASYWTCATLSIALLPVFYYSVSNSILEIPFKINNDIKIFQFQQIVTNLLRAILLSACFFLPIASIAILAASLPLIWYNKKLQIMSEKYVVWPHKGYVNDKVKYNLTHLVNRTLPFNIYSSLSEHISMWLVSILGVSSLIAELGAITRFGVAMRFLGLINNLTLVPKFSKISGSSSALLRSFLKIQTFNISILLIAIYCFNYFGHLIIRILGINYSHLTFELTLVIISSSFEVLASVTQSINSSRGWIVSPLFNITANILIVIIYLFSLKDYTLENIIMLGVVVNTFRYIMQLTFSLNKIKNYDNIMTTIIDDE